MRSTRRPMAATLALGPEQRQLRRRRRGRRRCGRELGRRTDAGEPDEGIRRRLGRKGWATLAIFAPAAQRSRARLEALLALDGVDEADRVLPQRLELLCAAARDPQLVHGEVVPDQ